MQFNFEKLIVWQKSMELVDWIYDLVKKFPRSETIILITGGCMQEKVRK